MTKVVVTDPTEEYGVVYRYFTDLMITAMSTRSVNWISLKPRSLSISLCSLSVILVPG